MAIIVFYRMGTQMSWMNKKNHFYIKSGWKINQTNSKIMISYIINWIIELINESNKFNCSCMYFICLVYKSTLSIYLSMSVFNL